MTDRSAGQPDRTSATGTLRALRARGPTILRSLVHDPRDVVDRWVERRAQKHQPTAPAYPLDQDWEANLHARLGYPWPCPEREEFWEFWADRTSALKHRGLPVGRGTFAGWNDGDPALGRASWCLVRHTKARSLVETGVARGLTTAVLLEALQRNGGPGRLWSIDLPPLGVPVAQQEIAAAVPAEARIRWTYVHGSSRRRLPRLLNDLAGVDVFVHDSLHTQRNVLFELTTVWPFLRPGGAVLVDDVDFNAAFSAWRAGGDDPSWPGRARAAWTAPHDDHRGAFGLILDGGPQR